MGPKGAISSGPDAQPDRPDAHADKEESVEPIGLRPPHPAHTGAPRPTRSAPQSRAADDLPSRSPRRRRTRMGAADAERRGGWLSSGARRRSAGPDRRHRPHLGAAAGPPCRCHAQLHRLLRQELRSHLRVAAPNRHHPADPRVATDFLLPRGVHRDASTHWPNSNSYAPPRSPLRVDAPARAEILVSGHRDLILAGFLSPPEKGRGRQTADPPSEGDARDAVVRRRVDLGADMDSAHDVHDQDVLGMRQRRAPLRAARYHPRGDKNDDIATATADRGGGGNRPPTSRVVGASCCRSRSRSPSSRVQLPLARARSASTSQTRWGHSLPSHWSSPSALPPCEADQTHWSGPMPRSQTTSGSGPHRRLGPPAVSMLA